VAFAFCARELLVENYGKHLANSNWSTPLSESRARNLSLPVFVVWQQYGRRVPAEAVRRPVSMRSPSCRQPLSRQPCRSCDAQTPTTPLPGRMFLHRYLPTESSPHPRPCVHLPAGFSCKIESKKEPTSGLEPLTCSLRVDCSIVEGTALCDAPLLSMLSIPARPVGTHPYVPTGSRVPVQTIGSDTLDRSVEAVGWLLDVRAAPASKRPAFGFTALPGSPFVIVPSLYRAQQKRNVGDLPPCSPSSSCSIIDRHFDFWETACTCEAMTSYSRNDRRRDQAAGKGDPP
jgi:hypothetical protein